MIDWLERNQRLLLAAVLACLFFLLLARWVSEDAPPGIEFRTDSPLPAGAPIRVQVDGAVLRPGVYALRQGDRVVDALAAAGGTAADAETEDLNLARRLRDEERITVPFGGQAAAEAQLNSLPGIGDAYARRIIDSRVADGPFKTIDELVARRVIPRATFDLISSLIVVRP
jgi:competence protein ComEA